MNSSKSVAMTVGLVALGVASGVAVWQRSGGGTATAGLLDRIPADATIAVLVPSHRKAIDQVLVLRDRFRQGIPAVDAVLDEGSRRAGFDVTRPESMRELGFDPDGGTAFAAGPDWTAIWLAVSDRAAFERFLADRTQREAGDELEWISKSHGGIDAKALSTKGDEPEVVLALAFDRGYAVVAANKTMLGEPADPVELLGRLTGVKAEAALGARPAVASAMRRMGESPAAVAWMDLRAATDVAAEVATERKRGRDAEALGRLRGYVNGLMVGLSVGATGVRMPVFAGIAPEKLAEIKAAFTPKAGGPDYGKVVPSDGTLLLSLASNPNGLVDWLRQILLDRERKALDDALADTKAQTGIDVEADMLASLSGHVGFVFHTLDLRQVGQGLLRKLDPQAAAAAVVEKTAAVDTSTWIGLSDPAKIEQLVREGVEKLKAGESAWTVEETPGKPEWRLVRDEVETAGFAIVGNTLVFTTGTGRLAKVQASLAGDGKAALASSVSVPDGQRGLSPANNLSLFLSVPILFKNFPILNLISVVKPLKAVGEVVARLELEADGVEGELLVTLQPPPKPEGKAP